MNCSCTILWIIGKDKVTICNKFDHNRCNFIQMRNKCNKSIFRRAKINKIDMFYFSEQLSFINLTLFPIICILGMITSILSIVSFRSIKLKNNLNQKLYKLILVSFYLNFLFCFIYIFHMVSVCITFTGRFCSIFKQNILVQNYEKFVIEFLGNIIKTSSNIISILISVERYFALDFINKRSISQINGLKLNILKIILLIFVVLLNFQSVLTIKINNIQNPFNKMEYFDSPKKFNFRNSLVDSYGSLSPLKSDYYEKHKLYFIWYLINFIFIDILLYILSALAELFLLMKFRFYLKNKIKILNYSCEKKKRK